MSFLPNLPNLPNLSKAGLSGTDESLQGILSVLVALPLSLAGTMLLFYLSNFG
jgi:hypothetical protein